MLIKLSEIKASPKPIRSTWDEEKMNELAQSIKEQGLIVPIKVRPNSNGHYEIIYGHRRVEATRLAGLDKIEAIIEGMDNEELLWQSIIENVCREDMTQFDEGDIYKRLKEEYEIPTHKIAKKVGRSQTWINRCIALVHDPISTILIEQHAVNDPADIAELTRAPLKDDLKSRKAIIEKMVKEGLNRSQTRKVVLAVAAAKTPEEKQAILETSIDNPIFDQIVQAKTRAKKKIKKDNEKERQERSREVKEYLDAMSDFEKAIIKAVDAAGYGRFSPEAAQYTINRHSKLTNILIGFNDVLENVK